MKKFIVAFACIAVLAAACSSSGADSGTDTGSSTGSSSSISEAGSTAKGSTPDSMTELAMSKITPQGELLKLSEQTVKNFYTLPENTRYSIYVSSVFTADELAVLELKDGRDELVEAAKARLTALKNSLKDYKPDVYTTVDENAGIYTVGDSVILISGSAENVSAAKSALAEAYGEELKSAE